MIFLCILPPDIYWECVIEQDLSWLIEIQKWEQSLISYNLQSSGEDDAQNR